MKTFRMIGMALVAVVLGFAMSSCENDDDVDPYKDCPFSEVNNTLFPN